MASARSVATATLSFGLVSVPVKLFTATNAQSGVSFNMLHKGCGSRLKQQYLCAKEGVVVERSDTVKGYEFSKDQYVQFTPEEIEKLEAEASQTIEICEFVPQSAVDPVYFDKAYFLAPDKGGARAYSLLAQAMRESGKVAVARYAARGKQYIVMVRPIDGGLAIQQLYYGDEVRSMKDVPGLEPVEVKPAELSLAQMLIDQISKETFDPSQYEDDVKKRMLEAIDRKVAGANITSSEEAPKTAEIIDIMEALKASLAGKRPADAGPPLAKADEATEEAKPKRTKKTASS